MKRVLFLIVILVVIFSVSLSGTESRKKMFIEFQGNMMFPSDSNFKNIYGSSAIYIRGKSGYKIFGDVYLFFGCGLLNKTGTTPVLKVDATTKQKICIIGAGYEGTFSGKFGYRLEAGGANFSYKEEALNETANGNKIGIMLNGSLVYDFSKTFFATFSLGYFGTSDTIEGVNIKLGGLHTSIGAGVRL